MSKDQCIMHQEMFGVFFCNGYSVDVCPGEKCKYRKTVEQQLEIEEKIKEHLEADAPEFLKEFKSCVPEKMRKEYYNEKVQNICE